MINNGGSKEEIMAALTKDNINDKQDGSTPLSYAIVCNREDIAKAILYDKIIGDNVDVNIGDDVNRYPRVLPVGIYWQVL